MVYDFSIVNPPAEVATNWEWPKTTLPIIVRVREVDGQPIVIEYTYMPLELIPGLKKRPVRIDHSFIREQWDSRSQVSTVPFAPSRQLREEAERLDTKPGSPARTQPDWLLG